MIGYESLMKELRSNADKEKRIARELIILYKQLNQVSEREEKKMILLQINSLKKYLGETNDRAYRNLKSMVLAKPFPKTQQIPEKTSQKPEQPTAVQPATQQTATFSIPQSGQQFQRMPAKRIRLKLSKELEPEGLEKETLKRLKKKEEKIVKEKKKKPNKYAQFANKIFYNKSIKLIHKKMFYGLERELVKGNLQFTPTTYISIIYFTTLLSIFGAILIFLFFLFFNIGAELPIITLAREAIGLRLLKTFWIVPAIPVITFLIMYFYPSLEKKSTANRINGELPFATINMAAISGSLIDPSKIFQIIITTKEYPYLSKEFTKIMNEINIHGYNFVSALRNASFNSASKKLSELFSGLATTINSGGDLPDFFKERSETLLFEHRLEKEKQAKGAETFMDIYISLVIAAPMILMLLLMMMKISGLGVSFSTGTITLMMVLGITVINIIFLAFLHLRKD